LGPRPGWSTKKMLESPGWRANRAFMSRPPRRCAAFTLVELLVVVAIIAILAALAIPAAGTAINSAKKTAAKSLAGQIVTAIMSYESEYGALPSNSGTICGPALVGILCTSTDSVNNPRGIVFLEPMNWSSSKGGTNAKGICDPFSATNVYYVSLDTNYVYSQTNVSSAPR
jgi:prepilin-type N-terminal cleavage/methylation domain-containing protein